MTAHIKTPLGLGGEPVTRKFGFTGDVQTLDLPAGVKKLEITAIGAAGGSGSFGNKHFGGAGGSGSKVHADITLNGGSLTLHILVGGKGESGGTFRAGDGGFNGGGSGASAGGAGGGGGASEVRLSGDIGSRIIVAGGGGGGGASGSEGPGGRGGNGSAGGADGHSDPIDIFTCHGRGGGAGTSNGGGSGGNSPCAGDGIGGGRLVGGRGGISVLGEGGGGGGGGYFGGGGGGGAGGGSGAGGGGGSSFVTPGATHISDTPTTETAAVDITYSIPVPVITCTSPVQLKIGQQIDPVLVVCRTDVLDGDITLEGPDPGASLFIGPETVGGPLVVAVGTFPGHGVMGPARDYDITVKAFNDGGPVATAHVIFKVTA